MKRDNHQEILELLPWLVNDTLEGKEKLRVLKHLTECTECQQERDRLQSLAALVEADHQADSLDMDYKPSFEKLMDQIDRQESEIDLSSDQTSSRRASAPVALAAAASVILMAAGFTFMQVGGPQMETLSVPESALEESPSSPRLTQRVGVTFEKNIDSERLRAAFVKTGAYIVSGPDADGRYIVEVERRGDDVNQDLLSDMARVDGIQNVALLD